MEVIIQPTPEAATDIAAEVVASLIRRKPNAVLGLATGNTPIPLYRKLAQMHREDQLDFGLVTTFNLDEYVGLSPNDPSSYHQYMWEHLFQHINIARERIHIPDGLAKDIAACCHSYEGSIRAAGGIDLQLLGLGGDGHIGFNEPVSSFASRTRLKTLTPLTRSDNASFFGGDYQVPSHVITMGIQTITEARQVILLAFGEKKSSAVAAALEGPVTPLVSASALHFHPQVTAIIDEAAASQLCRKDYYRWVYTNKPEWQRSFP